MTTCPNPVQYVGVSTTVKPVTQTALVEVNNAVTKPAPPGPDSAIGSINSPVPTATAAANPVTTTCAGCRNRTPDRPRPPRPVLTDPSHSAFG